MFNNLSYKKFKDDIDSVINNCGLPPVAAYYILKDSLRDLENICNEVLIYEKENPTETKSEKTVDLTGLIPQPVDKGEVEIPLIIKKEEA